MIGKQFNSLNFDQLPRKQQVSRGLNIMTWMASSLLIMLHLGVFATINFALYAMATMLTVFYFSCRHCTYHGHACDPGLGSIASHVIHRKGNLVNASMKCRFGLPMMLILFVAPVFAGITVLINGLHFPVLMLMLANVFSADLWLLKRHQVKSSGPLIHTHCPLCLEARKED